MTQTTQATLDDLARVAERAKAELVNGMLVRMLPCGFLPNYVAGEIYASLREYARRTRAGYAIADNAGFVVDLPRRKSLHQRARCRAAQRSGRLLKL